MVFLWISTHQDFYRPYVAANSKLNPQNASCIIHTIPLEFKVLLDMNHGIYRTVLESNQPWGG